MKLAELKAEILRKKSFLCVGLDVDLEKIPAQCNLSYLLPLPSWWAL